MVNCSFVERLRFKLEEEEEGKDKEAQIRLVFSSSSFMTIIALSSSPRSSPNSWLVLNFTH